MADSIQRLGHAPEHPTAMNRRQSAIPPKQRPMGKDAGRNAVVVVVVVVVAVAVAVAVAAAQAFDLPGPFRSDGAGR